MNVAEIVDLYEYNRWAHERVLEVARGFTDEQYSQEIISSFPSFRATLEHMLVAEVLWLSRWEGHSLGEPPDYSGCTNVTSLGRLWQYYWKRQFQFLGALTEDELARPIAIRTRGGIETVQPLVETMLHLVTHSSYHRGQAATLTRQLGGTPMTTDYFFYCLRRGAGESDSGVTP